MLACVGVALLACEPPDSPPALSPGLPAAAEDLLQPDRTRTFRIETGVTYREVRSAAYPWVVHLLEIDLTRCELGFRVEGSWADSARVVVSELARRAEPGALAAVNGDFYTPEDRPIGVEASGGAVRGRGSGPVFAWRPGGPPWIGPVEWEADSLRVGDWTVPVDEPDGHTEIVGGFPALLEEGAWVGDLLQTERPAFAAERHPRTAVAHDADRRRLWWVVADGRERGSEGMTLPELARLLQALGAASALNLDGGGSSVMVIRGEPVSRPSQLQGERPVANALVLRRDPSYCRAAGARAE